LSTAPAHALSWTVVHEQLDQGTDFGAVYGPVTWSYGYWAASGNSTVILSLRSASGWSWQEFQSSYCPSQFPYCYFSGRIDVPSGFQLVQVVVSSQAADGVLWPNSGWVYLPVANLHCCG
jgi:hypothetical protein